ncbi:Transposase, Mutator family [Rhodococcoides kyotonense]|uniref:Mutator family transposase n=1 Tax=Rhodococcoides kyotonense TaxID=398843 RepID=A0A239M3G7_9NOCA|nr:Transposase, Mutator family [Rhodococcus kyotonensis]
MLGIWVQEHEGAKFWAGICAELANRGLKDVIIACTDGLTGFGDAIEATWPNTVVQTCTVHLIRASMRFVAYGDRKAVAAALKLIYTAPTVEAAEAALTDFKTSKWGSKLPTAVRTWESAWERFIPFLAFPPAVRKIIYTTNAIESLNYQLRKIIKIAATSRMIKRKSFCGSRSATSKTNVPANATSYAATDSHPATVRRPIDSSKEHTSTAGNKPSAPSSSTTRTDSTPTSTDTISSFLHKIPSPESCTGPSANTLYYGTCSSWQPSAAPSVKARPVSSISENARIPTARPIHLRPRRQTRRRPVGSHQRPPRMAADDACLCCVKSSGAADGESDCSGEAGRGERSGCGSDCRTPTPLTKQDHGFEHCSAEDAVTAAEPDSDEDT